MNFYFPDTVWNGVLIIVNYPSEQDFQSQEWFCDGSGRFLRGVAQKWGLSIDSCSIMSLHTSSVDSVDANNWWLFHDKVKELKPRLILLMEPAVLQCIHPGAPGTFSALEGYIQWSPVYNCKFMCLPHPRNVMQSPDISFAFRLYLRKAAQNAHSSQLQHLDWTNGITLCTEFPVAIAKLTELIALNVEFAYDIEGYADQHGIECIGFATSPVKSFVVPFTHLDGRSYWTPEEEAQLWPLVAQLLQSRVNKILHNSAYEHVVLHARHKIVCSAPYQDTYIMWHGAYVEAQKSLEFCASCALDTEPWKDDRTTPDFVTKLRYNAKDCMATFALRNYLLHEPHAVGPHNQLMHKAAFGYNYMALRGIRYDTALAAKYLADEEAKLAPTLARLQAACGRAINPKSAPDKKWLLYEFLKLPPMGRYGDTTKELVLLKYWTRTRNPILQDLLHCIWARTRISDIQKLTTLNGRVFCSYNLAATSTWRANSSESNLCTLVPPKTARGSVKRVHFGTNLQNVTKDLRACFIPDEGMYIWQVDLAGADAWTVAADLAALGEYTMLEDLQAGIKPSKVLLLMLLEMKAGRPPNTINRLSRAELKARTKALDTDGELAELYLCMKRVQHGTNYCMGPELVSDTVFKDTEGETNLAVSDAATYQNLYKLRYPVDLRLQQLAKQLRDTGSITSAAGTYRYFFATRGGHTEHEILAAAAASNPQTNTTHVINLALVDLVFDPANRRRNGAFFIEPLFQVHDALGGQFPCNLVDFTRERIAAYFAKPLQLGSLQLTIPYEGHFGPNWKDQPYNL